MERATGSTKEAQKPPHRTESAWLLLLLSLLALLIACGGDSTQEVSPPTADSSDVDEARARCLVLYHTTSAFARSRGSPPQTLAETIPPPPPGEGTVQVPEDPWGSPYEIWLDGETMRIRSLGPDRQRDTEDDIVHPLPD